MFPDSLKVVDATGVLVIGEALVDVIDAPSGTRETFGGSAANTALALGRLGRTVRLATALGDDDRGRGMRAWLKSAGVEADVTIVPRTAAARATLAADGSATYDFDLDWSVDLSRVEPGAVVHTGSIAAALRPGAEAVEAYLRRAKRRATVSVDPNIRPSLIDTVGRARVERILALADVIKLSDEDLEWLRPGTAPIAAASAWLDDAASVVVVTCGGRGAVGFVRAGAAAIEAVRVDVVDAVAAGDTFTAALLDALLAEGVLGAERRDALRDLRVEALERVLAFAATAAAITVGRRGADPPWRSEVIVGR